MNDFNFQDLSHFLLSKIYQKSWQKMYLDFY